MSILACVMGTLTLILCGLVFGQVKTPPSEEEYQRLSEAIVKMTEETQFLQYLITETLLTESQIEEIQG